MQLRRLRLAGPHREYHVDFVARDPSLAVIAGQIHTGKTTVLEMVDYCLGNDVHPTHPEVARRVRSVELEIESNGQVWTIERPVVSSEQVAWVRAGAIGDESPGESLRRTIDPPSASDSLSQWLLSQTGLEGTRVQVSQGNPNSTTHMLSFRDIMWVCFLPNQRLDNKALLHEENDYKNYKLQQVIEMLFGVHDSKLADLMRLMRELRDVRREHNQEIESLRIFLLEDDVPDVATIRRHLRRTRQEQVRLRVEIATIDDHMAGATKFASNLRGRYGEARRRHSALAAHLRDREALMARLLPLRGQYAEDEQKLSFFGEARRVFDPLRVQNCPSCMQALAETPRLDESQCTLCGQHIDSHTESEFDVDRERRALRDRIRNLDRYLADVEGEVREARRRVQDAEREELQFARELNARTAEQLSPYIEEREGLVRRLERRRAARRDWERQLRWQEALDRRTAELETLDRRIATTKRQIDDLRQNRPDRAEVITNLSNRFASMLRQWSFPKVDDPEAPYIDDRFVPIVRGRPYREIGSTGAMTLISLAWQLSIFETAVESGIHPGFLMLDSPQKNLSPKALSSIDEYTDPLIVRRMWEHIEAWTRDQFAAQVIVVDNTPPVEVDEFVVVRYTRDPSNPPYGLIDDEVESSTSELRE